LDLKNRPRLRRGLLMLTLVGYGLVFLLLAEAGPSVSSVTCNPGVVDVNGVSTCTVAASGFSAGGYVAWTQTDPGGLSFSPNYCFLSYGTCEVTGNGTAPGNVNVGTTYPGDYLNLGTGSNTTLLVNPLLTAPVIKAIPPHVQIGHSSKLISTTHVEGGTPSYACQWFSEVPGGTVFAELGTAFSCDTTSLPSIPTGALSVSGAWLYKLTVTDATGMAATSNTVEVLSSAGNGTSGSAVTLFCNPLSTSLMPARFRPGFNTIGAPSTPIPVSPAFVRCLAVVQGLNPSGTLSWKSTGHGTFSVTSCTLYQGRCQTRYTPTRADSEVLITAHYSGDRHNPKAIGSMDIVVNAASTKTRVFCADSVVLKRYSPNMKCWAVVYGYYPTGTVQWQISGQDNAVLSSDSCQVSNYICTVTIRGLHPGTVTIHAIYVGDQNNNPSSGGHLGKILK
jgi:hypothetical protein